jgi:hypothetical protein
MKRFLFVVGALAVSLVSAKANLGQNQGQIYAAYGKPIQKLPGFGEGASCLYQKGGFSYMVMFRGGVSVFETYSRANQAELSEKEIAAFLKANAAGATWVPVSYNKAPGREWKRSDHKAKASYVATAGRPTLTVMEATPK